MSSDLPVNLLAEEATINPQSPFPSFFEMELVNSTTLSGRRVLETSIDTLIAHLHRLRAPHNGNSSTSSNLLGFEVIRHKLVGILYRLLSQYKAEVQLIVNYIVEKKCLCSNAASTISESLYGLKRSKLSTSDGSISEMKDYDKIRAALVLSLWPYLKQRFDMFYEKKRDEQRQRRLDEISSLELTPITYMGRNRQQVYSTENRVRTEIETPKLNITEKMRRTFLYMYPFLHMTHDGMQLAYKFSYLIGQSYYYHPQWHLLGLIARRVTLQDMANGKKNDGDRKGTDQSNSNDMSNSFTDTLDKVVSDKTLSVMKKAVAGGVISLLMVGWLGKLRREIRRHRRQHINSSLNHGEEYVQSRRWGGERSGDHTSNNNNVNRVSNTPPNTGDTIVIPPPLPPPILDQVSICGNIDTSALVQPTRDRSLCPICLQKRLNATASSSGYVFCYKCIVLHIREHGDRCPITGLHCKETQLIRLFEPSEEVGLSFDSSVPGASEESKQS